MYINFHFIISIYNTFHLLFKRVRCQQNLNMYERRCLVSYKRELKHVGRQHDDDDQNKFLQINYSKENLSYIIIRMNTV